MTEQAQLTAIATACGWSTCTTPEGLVYALHWFDPTEGCELETTPLHDLNACHEMEKVLTLTQRWEYVCRLVLQQPGSNFKSDQWYILKYDNLLPPGTFPAVFAEPTQRCEAFLRTLNLWKD